MFDYATIRGVNAFHSFVPVRKQAASLSYPCTVQSILVRLGFRDWLWLAMSFIERRATFRSTDALFRATWRKTLLTPCGISPCESSVSTGIAFSVVG